MLTVLSFVTETALAQVQNFKELHKVKRKETIFGIARDNGLTIDELIAANPEMKTPGYELRKGDYIRIPYPPKHPELESVTPQPQMPTKPVVVEPDMRNRELRVGVMLPLHNDNDTIVAS